MGRPRKVLNKKTYKCVYCGQLGESEEFFYTHNCGSPMVFDKEKIVCPTRPRLVSYFEVSFCGKTFTFSSYGEAKVFRRKIWLQNQTLKDITTSSPPSSSNP